jgi:hypothetical protein
MRAGGYWLLVTTGPEPEEARMHDFLTVAQAATASWTVPTLPMGQIADVPEVAEYDGTTGEVRLMADRIGGTTPGHAAQRYIGRTTYVDLD